MSTVEESYLVGLIGSGVLVSLTPPLHEHEADALGLRYLYRPLDLDAIGRTPAQIGELLADGAALGYNGFNITHPCKQEVVQHLDELSPAAIAIGAANTVLIREGRFRGDNTDVSGFAAAMSSGLPGADLKSVVLLGAGGAGAAVSHALLCSGVKQLVIVDIDQPRAEQRVAEMAAQFPEATLVASVPDELPALLPGASGLVNATYTGMHNHPGMPVPVDLLRPDLWVADVVYRPIVTELVAAASALGCAVLDGGYMATAQAADTFQLITGIEPDRDRMRAHFLELIAQGR
jgi:shikimate dehydrogenase